jgi:hypothetical protein
MALFSNMYVKDVTADMKLPILGIMSVTSLYPQSTKQVWALVCGLRDTESSIQIFVKIVLYD